ncbi:MAG: U32 family peptidase [Rikenellaceae bacterium]
MTNEKINLELLAPAKNYEFGVAAINCGADAVYIGAPNFGARKAASNSVEDIAKLVKYAHLFNAKVYVAFNTLIYESEIETAQRLVSSLYEIGVDALIVQDMAFAKMKIPPIRLFASTQTANITPERVKFLEGVGFERVILERALSLSSIKQICETTTMDVECFVHGAICVSYSGNCYMSQYITGRSANRGECAQPCRSAYNVVNDDDKVLMRDAHILSLKDLSLSNNIGALAQSGVKSFKIEGRLKDMVYLKNSVSHFNRVLNEFIKTESCKYKRSSLGRSIVGFESNPNKSFSRMFTSYFIDNKQQNVATITSAKSFGEYVGKVTKLTPKGVMIEKLEGVELINGDGICFVSAKGEFSGTYINGVKDNVIELARNEVATIGSKIFRNHNKKFVDMLISSTEKRLLNVVITIKDGAIEISCNNLKWSVDYQFEAAQNIEKASEGLKQNFSKTANSIFEVERVIIECGTPPFLPIKIQNELRNSLFEAMQNMILDSYNFRHGKPLSPVTLEESSVSYKYNVANSLSREFYSECGAQTIDEAVELSGDFEGVELMRMAYCIRKEMGRCLKEKPDKQQLYLTNNSRRFKLQFDCKKCEMIVTTT